MTDSVSDFRQVASRWIELVATFRPPTPEARKTPGRPSLGEDRLLSLSQDVRKLTQEAVPRADTLDRAALAFDELAANGFPTDPFGERYELCNQLSFVAWRHAFGLGMESESQDWLRTAEFLALEYSTETDCLSTFLFLPTAEKTEGVRASRLTRSLDVFTALAVLRRERYSRAAEVANIAVDSYRWLSRNFPEDASSEESEFFLGELAYLASLALRYVGRLDSVSEWSRRARLHFRVGPSSRLARLKVLINSVIARRDVHDYVYFRRHVPKLQKAARLYGAYRDELVCRFALAMVDKVQGRNSEALSVLREIEKEWGNSSEYSIVVRVSASIGELVALRGERDLARESIARALEVADMSREPSAMAFVWSSLGAVLLEEGDRNGAARAFRESIARYAQSGVEYLTAYMRIVLAEVLISLLRIDEAASQLRMAVPVLSRLNMIPEGIHALKLAAEVVASSLGERKQDRELVDRLQKRFGGN